MCASTHGISRIRMSVRTHYIIIGKERHGYTLATARKVTHLICRSANIEDRFPNDEIPRILAELPRLIAAHNRAHAATQQTEVVRFRVTEEERAQIEHNAFTAGYDTISGYLRDVALKRKQIE